MDTLGIALIVVVVVIAIVVASLLHERSQVGQSRRMAEYHHARQVYETRRAIIIAQHQARIEAARGGTPSSSPPRAATALLEPPVSRTSAPAAPAPATPAAPERADGVAVPSADAIDAFLDADPERAEIADAVHDGEADVAQRRPGRTTWRERRRQRKQDQEVLPAWVHRPLRPGEDPRTPWWVRLRGLGGLAVLVAILGASTAAAIGAVFAAAGLLLERFTG